jgi:hypothetical protein
MVDFDGIGLGGALNIGDDFDVIPPEVARRLRGDMFRVFQLVIMAVESPFRNAHLLAVACEVIEDAQEYLEEAGMMGEGDGPPGSPVPEPDFIDLIGTYTQQGLVHFLRKRYGDDDDD